MRECKVASVVPTLCDPMDCIAHQARLSMGILQARILERVAMPSSRDSGIKHVSFMSPALTGWFPITSAT